MRLGYHRGPSQSTGPELPSLGANSLVNSPQARWAISKLAVRSSAAASISAIFETVDAATASSDAADGFKVVKSTRSRRFAPRLRQWCQHREPRRTHPWHRMQNLAAIAGAALKSNPAIKSRADWMAESAKARIASCTGLAQPLAGLSFSPWLLRRPALSNEQYRIEQCGLDVRQSRFQPASAPRLLLMPSAASFLAALRVG